MIPTAPAPRDPAARIFSIGYEGRTLEDLIGLLKKAGIERLIDVREAPFSRKPGFSKKPLEQALQAANIEYIGMPKLGADKALRDRFRSERDLPAFLEEFRRRLEGRKEPVARLEALARERPSAVMCFERDHRDCHRQVLEERLARDGFGIVHLGENQS